MSSSATLLSVSAHVISNMLPAFHATAPPGTAFQANNVIVKKSPHPPREEGGLLSHVDLVQMLDIVDLEAGTTVAGRELTSSKLSALCVDALVHQLIARNV